MHLLKATVNEDRLMRSRSSLKQPTLKEFLPFENQRDNVGRLIKAPFQQTGSKSINSSKMSLEKQSALLEENIHKYFKHNNRNGMYQTNKNTILKKTIINLMTGDVPVKKKIKSMVSVKQWVDKIRESCDINQKFCRTADSNKFRNFSRGKKSVKRVQSSTIHRYNFEHSPLRQISSTELSPQKPTQRSVSCKQSRNYEQYPELQRFVQMQSLEMKTLDNFEESHVKFLMKMKESKQLAFQLRHNIQQIDYY